MKKLVITLSLAFCLCFATVTSFAQSATAAHAYLNLTSLECPYLTESGYERTSLLWKSEAEVPSIPEVNEFVKFWPEEPSDGDCGKGGNTVVPLSEKVKFPVDLPMIVEVTIGGGDYGTSVVEPTQNFEGSVTVGEGTGNLTTYTYYVTFE